MSTKENLDNFKKAYAFFKKMSGKRSPFTYEDIATAVPDWKPNTVRTYASKKWREFLPSKSKNFILDVGKFPYSEQEFIRMSSQVNRKSSNPFKPELPENVEVLVEKAKESAVLAVSIYNSTQESFRSQGYIVLMIIAWTALLQAIFEQEGIDYYYRNKDGSYIINDGEPKTWELGECIQHCQKLFAPAKANIELFIRLRNKIEHRYAPEFDISISGECQSLLFNFEELLTSSFGTYYSLHNTLSIPLQIVNKQSPWQLDSHKKLQKKHYKELRSFLDDYRRGLPEEVFSDQQYAFRAFLVPKIGNHRNSSDIAIEFIKYDPTQPELFSNIEKGIVAIREKTIQVANQGKLKPKMVCKLISERIGRKFSINSHAKAWKYYKVRADSGKSPACKAEYCQYDEAHGDYIYTMEWVDFLVRELSDDDTYKKILTYK